MRQMIYTRDTLPETLMLKGPARIRLELEELPSAGYVWSVEASPPGSIGPVVEERPAALRGADGVPGAPEVWRAAFTVVESGLVTLTYRRPWEAEIQEKISFRILMDAAAKTPGRD